MGVFPLSEVSRAGHLRHYGGDGSPWSKRREKVAANDDVWGPIPLEELHEIAEESSQAERRADEAERELMEWKKAKFMEQHIGDEFDGLIISVTKFGFFVELTELFVEGLVPLASLTDDRYVFSRKYAGDHRLAHPQNLPHGTKDSGAGRAHRSGGKENSVCRGGRGSEAEGVQAEERASRLSRYVV